MSAYIKRSERSQINKLMLHLKIIQKQEQAKCKLTEEIIKISSEINEIEIKKRKTIQRINETKSWFFEKIKKIDKTLANLSKMKRKKTEISK
jgi:hypothetical protein